MLFNTKQSTRIASKIYLLAILVLVLTVGCIEAEQKKASENRVVETKKSTFTPPAIPTHIDGREAQLKHLLEHFWDKYNFADSLLLADSQTTGKAFAIYAELLPMSDSATIERSIKTLLNNSFKVDSMAFAHFATLFEDYFHNANSPYMNEEIYIPVLRYIIENDSIEPINKLRPQIQLEMALKNRVGELSLDFEYMLKSGRNEKMHNIVAPYTILFFNNPDCHDCARVKEYFTSSELLNALHHDGELKILSIYPDSTIELWKKEEYPAMMINGFDKSQKISTERLYDLKAIPTLYLLDKDKKVILKDAPIEMIENYLQIQ